VIVDTIDLTSSTGTDSSSSNTEIRQNSRVKTDEKCHVYFVDRCDYDFNSYYKQLTEKPPKNCPFSQRNVSSIQTDLKRHGFSFPSVFKHQVPL
jgi:hypothetical protein